MSKEVKEDSVGDVKVGELGFGSVAEGGSFIALPNASVSQEIKLEGGGESLTSIGGNAGVNKSRSKEGSKASSGGKFQSKSQIIEEKKVLSTGNDTVSVGNKESEVSVKEVDDKGLEESKVGLAAGEEAFGDSASSVNGSSIVESTAGSATAEGDRLAIAPEDSISIGIGKIGANSITSSLLEEERLKYKELAKKHKDDHEAHLKEVERLSALIDDLSRRLQNANHTIEATKKVSKQASHTANRFRSHMGQVSNALRLETAKNATVQRKKLHAEEAQRFELNKKKATKAHDNVRMAILDHSMTGMKTPTQKILNMKKNIKQM